MLSRINELDVSSFDENDTFLIDTNILCYLHSTYSYTSDEISKVKAYSNFVSHLRKNGCTLLVSTLNLQEMFHAIERIEFKTYCQNRNVLINSGSKKNYRKLIPERRRIKSVHKLIWNQITQYYKVLEDGIKTSAINSFIDDFSQHQYDPIDYIVVKSHPEGLNVITDDNDFIADDNINVFTY